MIGFTDLERGVLLAICDARPKRSMVLRRLLESAWVIGRDNTGHGFYTTFEVDQSLAEPVRDAMIFGPNAHMRDMGEGNLMGFILWYENGYPTCLEGYQYAGVDGETVDLKERDLATLAYSRLEPETTN